MDAFSRRNHQPLCQCIYLIMDNLPHWRGKSVTLNPIHYNAIKMTEERAVT